MLKDTKIFEYIVWDNNYWEIIYIPLYRLKKVRNLFFCVSSIGLEAYSGFWDDECTVI